MQIRNFGRNVVFSPRQIHRASSEDELLDILGRHANGRIRARGSLHSWSGAAATNHVLLEMEKLDRIDVSDSIHEPRVRVGAGCRLDRLVEMLDRHDLALPTNGAVLEQTISGAISTGTHGSGNKTLSSFVRRLRLARLDAAGAPAILEIDGGRALHAARCAIGCGGIITELEIELARAWMIEERFEKAGSLHQVLDGEKEWPLQQFFLLPYRWTYYVFRRRRVGHEASWLRSHLYKAYNVVSTDALAHILFKAVVTLQKLGSNGSVIGFFRTILPRLLVTGLTVTGDSTLMSTLNHHWFRHLEMEIFVPDENLPAALDVVRELTAFYAGQSDAVPDDVLAAADRAGLRDHVLSRRGFYAHHYPIFLRRVLNDDTLVSMASPRDGVRCWYSISLFCYIEPRQRFLDLADTVLAILRNEFGARPHWGKYHRLVREEIDPLYPRIDEFREVCRELDPRGIFTNPYTERTFGLGRSDR